MDLYSFIHDFISLKLKKKLNNINKYKLLNKINK